MSLLAILAIPPELAFLLMAVRITWGCYRGHE